MAERRRYHRKVYRDFVDYSDGDRFYQRSINNSSVGGMFIRTSNPAPLNSEVKLCFTVLDSPFNIFGEVVRYENDGMGVEFLFGKLEHRHRLKRLGDAL